MAAVSLSPLPTSMSSKPSRRVPLSNNINAINSPFRTVGASTTVSKPKRSHASLQLEETYGQPPAKKQILESYQVLKTPPRHQAKQSASVGIQPRKENVSQQLLHERKALKAMEKTQKNVTKTDWSLIDDHESIRQWQKHNRRMFPSFVFYFENVASEAQVKYTKAVVSLGAREEKFFSNTVTHVITTRNIPPETQVSSIVPPVTSSNPQSHQNQSQISSTSLDKSIGTTNTSEPVSKLNYMREASTDRKPTTNVSIGDSRRQQGRNTDVLHKARELGMRIWSLEKLERIINVIFDTDTGYYINHGNKSWVNPISKKISRLSRETDLQQLLRNERINGPSDRDLTVASKELYTFKGPYIYIHDINEKQKPIMVREYPKVYNKEDGDWPQFRSVANGKCPFIDEVDYSKREAEREMEQIRIRRQLEKEKACIAGKAAPFIVGQQLKSLASKRVLEEVFNDVKSSSVVMAKPKNIIDPARKLTSSKSGSKSSTRGNAFVSRAGIGRLHEGEPVASGVQPVITSAIRSAMSSTAAQPGLKAGTSKEVYGMQRKVLEKNILAVGSHDLQNPYQPTESKLSAQDDMSTQACRKKIQEKVIIDEISENSQAQEILQKTESTQKTESVQQPATARPESRPGYCENCQDKFEDFNEHVVSRKHRRFAEKLDNWKALDKLLVRLARPLRDYHDDKNQL